MGVDTHLAKRVIGLSPSPIDRLFTRLGSMPDVVSFAVGIPDPALLPVELISELATRAIARYGPTALQYGTARGFTPLRRASVDLLAERDITVTAEDIHISTGSSGALDTLCMTLIDPGDVVLVEEPTYHEAIKVFRTHGARVEQVACDEQGMRPDELARHLRGHRVAFTYLMPTFQNPTGRTTPASRRAELASVLVRYNGLAVEDDPYWQLRYDGTPLAALWSSAPENVAYLTSLSKTLTPALRIGITVLPRVLREYAVPIKQGVDMHTSVLSQALAAEFLTDPRAASHLSLLVERYRTKRDQVLSALHTHLPRDSGFRWTEPEGGMFTWLTGPPGLDTRALLPSALTHAVAYLPGAGFHSAPDEGANTLRLSFASAALSDIGRGVAALADVLTPVPQLT